jgi:hypothetical protein
MASIYSYQKHTDNLRTYELQLPYNDSHERQGTELATIDGITYVSLPDGAVLPSAQPEQIAASITAVTLTDTLRDQIKVASPHVALINQRVVEAIRERYSVDDEIKMLRLAPSDQATAYNAYAEECRAWGRQQKALLGL